MSRDVKYIGMDVHKEAHWCKRRIASAANGNSGPIVDWALRPATVRNIAGYGVNCNARRSRNRFAV